MLRRKMRRERRWLWVYMRGLGSRREEEFGKRLGMNRLGQDGELEVHVRRDGGFIGRCVSFV